MLNPRHSYGCTIELDQENRASSFLSVQCLVNEDKDVGRSCGKIRAVRAALRDSAAALRKESNGSSSLLGLAVKVPRGVRWQGSRGDFG